jgi:hypothetical protein
MELIIIFGLLYALYLDNNDVIYLSKSFKLFLLLTLTMPVIGTIVLLIFQYKIWNGIVRNYIRENYFI